MWSCPALQQRLRSACVDFTLEYPVPLLSFSLQLVDLAHVFSNPPLVCHIWAPSSLGRPLCVIHLKAYSLYEICHFCVSVSLWRVNTRPQSHFLPLQPHLHLRLRRHSKCGLPWKRLMVIEIKMRFNRDVTFSKLRRTSISAF